MRFQMADESAFCALLSLNGVVDKKIETFSVAITIQNRQKLLFMQHNQSLNGFTKRVQEVPRIRAIRHLLRCGFDQGAIL